MKKYLLALSVAALLLLSSCEDVLLDLLVPKWTEAPGIALHNDGNFDSIDFTQGAVEAIGISYYAIAVHSPFTPPDIPDEEDQNLDSSWTDLGYRNISFESNPIYFGNNVDVYVYGVASNGSFISTSSASLIGELRGT